MHRSVVFSCDVHFDAQHSFTLSHLHLSLSHRQFLLSHPVHVQGQQELSVQPEHLQSEPHLQLAEVRRRVKCLANDTLITTNLLHFLQVVRSQQPLPSVHLQLSPQLQGDPSHPPQVHGQQFPVQVSPHLQLGPHSQVSGENLMHMYIKR